MAPHKGQNRWREESLEKRDEVCAVRPCMQQIKSKGVLKRHQIPLLALCWYCHYLVFQLSGVPGRTRLLGLPWCWWLVNRRGATCTIAAGAFASKESWCMSSFLLRLNPSPELGLDRRDKRRLLMSALVAWSWSALLVHLGFYFFLGFCNSTSICSYWRASGVSGVPDLSCSLPVDGSWFFIIGF